MTIAPDVPGKFGRKCVRLANDRPSGYVQMYWQCAPQHEVLTEYVWSLWLRGAKGGEKVALRGPSENRTVTLTADWVRHSVPVVVEPRLSLRSSGSCYSVRLSRRGAVWIDGMQLEKGSDATPFQE